LTLRSVTREVGVFVRFFRRRFNAIDAGEKC
jgi:hypothetical protein